MKKIKALSDYGKANIGHIFPDGVPVLSHAPVWVVLGKTVSSQVYLADWKAFSNEQKELVLVHITEKHPDIKEEVVAEIDEKGWFPISRNAILETIEVCIEP